MSKDSLDNLPMKNIIPIYHSLLDLPLADTKSKIRDLILNLRKRMDMKEAIYFAQVLINDEREDLAQQVLDEVIRPKLELDMQLT